MARQVESRVPGRSDTVWRLVMVAALAVALLAPLSLVDTASAIRLDDTYKGVPVEELLSSGGRAALFGPDSPIQSPGEFQRGAHDNGRGGNTFVNDPCLDPPPPDRQRTVQSETEIAVLNNPRSGEMGRKMVAGYNDSFGFYDREEGLSGYAYSTDGGNTWIDGGGLPPRVPGGHGQSPFTPGVDGFFGDPVVVVHQRTETFFYASIYKRPDGIFTLSVSRGRFTVAPPQDVESVANTRCLNQPEETGVPDPPQQQRERLVWEPPFEAIVPPFLGPGNEDFLDKEWLYVDQNSGTLYLTYTRFAADGSTPIELVRCVGCANNPGQPLVFTPPSVIVPNELADFNQATMPFTTPTGRVIVTWFARTFDPVSGAEQNKQRIEYAYSDDDGVTFSPEQLVAFVNPQGEPPGYNRRRLTILNAPYIFVDRGQDDGVFTEQERARPGFGDVYITYFSGKQPFGTLQKAADIFLSASRDNGTTFQTHTKVNDDSTNTVHVFPNVQVDRNGAVYTSWIDRRQDPGGNIFNDTWAAVSRDFGLTFGHNVLQTDRSTDWFVRADARPNFGDYNSSELIAYTGFVMIWADGRFRPPGGQTATPDTIFSIATGLGVGNDPNTTR